MFCFLFSQYKWFIFIRKLNFISFHFVRCSLNYPLKINIWKEVQWKNFKPMVLRNSLKRNFMIYRWQRRLLGKVLKYTMVIFNNKKWTNMSSTLPLTPEKGTEKNTSSKLFLPKEFSWTLPKKIYSKKK